MSMPRFRSHAVATPSDAAAMCRGYRSAADEKADQVFFFDSHGGLHVTLPRGMMYEECMALGAAAFGPAGISRRASDEEAGLVRRPGETAWAAAHRLGRLRQAEADTLDWDTLRY